MDLLSLADCVVGTPGGPNTGPTTGPVRKGKVGRPRRSRDWGGGQPSRRGRRLAVNSTGPMTSMPGRPQVRPVYLFAYFITIECNQAWFFHQFYTLKKLGYINKFYQNLKAKVLGFHLSLIRSIVCRFTKQTSNSIIVAHGWWIVFFFADLRESCDALL